MLDRLIETGLFGNTRPEAARIALYDHCKLLVAQGTLQMPPPLAGRDAAPCEERTTAPDSPLAQCYRDIAARVRDGIAGSSRAAPKIVIEA